MNFLTCHQEKKMSESKLDPIENEIIENESNQTFQCFLLKTNKCEDNLVNHFSPYILFFLFFKQSKV